MPLKASAPMRNVQKVRGIFLRRLPICQMSCSWCIPMMTEPALKNRSALKKACVVR